MEILNADFRDHPGVHRAESARADTFASVVV
jgi:hypothetical protein